MHSEPRQFLTRDTPEGFMLRQPVGDIWEFNNRAHLFGTSIHGVFQGRISRPPFWAGNLILVIEKRSWTISP
jgi:hypothetical protein